MLHRISMGLSLSKDPMKFHIFGSSWEVVATLSISTGLAGEAGAGQDVQYRQLNGVK